MTHKIIQRASALVIAIGLLSANAWSQTPKSPVMDDPGDIPVDAIPGYTNVTSPLQPTGNGRQFNVGGGSDSLAELDEVPWQSLRPGDVVNIYYRAEPYRHKILLSEQGTATNPIVINGVTDSSGTRPTIHAADAVTVNADEWNDSYQTTLIMINKRNRTGQYGVNASHYRIMNLRLTGVRPENQYTYEGVQRSYQDFSRAIWSAGGQYIELSGMIIEDNGSGLFVQANDDPGSLSKTWTIRGNKFENNGHGARDHQIYLQSVSDPGEYNIVEGNYFGPPTPNQSSIAQLKVRSTGTVVRYNWFNSAHRTLDIVEAQDAIPDWMYRNYSATEIRLLYRSSYVYGNVFVNDFSATSGQPAGRPLHFGADTLDSDATWGSSSGAAPTTESGMRGFESPTFFFHNTFYMRANSGQLWRGGLFDAENNNSDVTPSPGIVEAWNNVIVFDGSTRIGGMNRSGTTDWNGVNLLYTDTLTTYAESDSFANTENDGDDPNVQINVNGELINSPAVFVNDATATLTDKNFELAGTSPAIGAAADLPAYLLAFPVEYQPNGQSGGMLPRASTSDLGAFQSAPE